MNHCPVYARIGGHAYGTTYPGPIGAIVSPHMLGLESTYPLAFASTLCGACAEVCPVKIPIPDILVRLRNEAMAQPDSEEASLRGSGADCQGHECEPHASRRCQFEHISSDGIFLTLASRRTFTAAGRPPA